MNYLLVIFLLLFVCHSVFLFIVVNNLINAPRITSHFIENKYFEPVSILIPARNEEKRIGKLLDSLLKQSYTNYEVIVLDDNSSDGTSNIVKQFIASSDKIKLIEGELLPEDWLGKNWACYQLALKAKYDLILFLDADLFLAEHALTNAMDIFSKNKLNMLSIFPSQQIKSVGEWFIVPLMNWLLLTFLPLIKVHKSSNSSFVAANGQFILMSKKDYWETGTHQAVKDKVVEDMELARILKMKNKKVMTALGDDAVFCSMYSSVKSALHGFSKNFYPGFNIGKLTFLLMITLFQILFLLPILFLFVNSIFVIIVIMILIERLFVSVMSKQNWFLNLLLHPFQMIVMLVVGLNSVFNSKKVWKGRKI